MTQLFGISTDVLLPRQAPWGFTVTKDFLQEVHEHYAQLLQAMDRLPPLRIFFQQAMDRQDFSGIFTSTALYRYQGTVLKVFFPPSQKDVLDGRTHGTSKMGMLKAFLILYCEFSDTPTVDLDTIYQHYCHFFAGLKGKGQALAKTEDFRAFTRRLFFLKFNTDICDPANTVLDVSEGAEILPTPEPEQPDLWDALIGETLPEPTLPTVHGVAFDKALQSLITKRNFLESKLQSVQGEIEILIRIRAEIEDSFRQEEVAKKELERIVSDRQLKIQQLREGFKPLSNLS